MNPKPPLKKRGKYDGDFQAEVLKMVENGQTPGTESNTTTRPKGYSTRKLCATDLPIKLCI